MSFKHLRFAHERNVCKDPDFGVAGIAYIICSGFWRQGNFPTVHYGTQINGIKLNGCAVENFRSTKFKLH